MRMILPAQKQDTTHHPRYGLTNSGIWDPYSISEVTIGRWTIVCFLVRMSLAGTASSNSNARMSVNSNAFILSSIRKKWIEITDRGQLTLRWRTDILYKRVGRPGTTVDYPKLQGYYVCFQVRTPIVQA
jgi:hypothetical protein